MEATRTSRASPEDRVAPRLFRGACARQVMSRSMPSERIGIVEYGGSRLDIHLRTAICWRPNGRCRNDEGVGRSASGRTLEPTRRSAGELFHAAHNLCGDCIGRWRASAARASGRGSSRAGRRPRCLAQMRGNSGPAHRWRRRAASMLKLPGRAKVFLCRPAPDGYVSTSFICPIIPQKTALPRLPAQNPEDPTKELAAITESPCGGTS